MLAETLDKVKGCVGKKDLLPVLKHVCIRDGWVTTTNGNLTVSAYTEDLKGLTVITPADKLIAAAKACTQPKFKITDGGRLSITGNKFRALLPILDEADFPLPRTINNPVSCINLLTVIRQLVQFVGEDASRPWACGILLHDNSAFATNNTVIAKQDIDWNGPSINIPNYLINELLRLKKNVLSINADEDGITLELEGGIWLNSNLLSLAWPNIKELLSSVDFNNMKEIPKELAEAIRTVLPFCPNPKFPLIRFAGNYVTTDEGVHQALVEIGGLRDSVWRAEPLLSLLHTPSGETLMVDLSQWPRACPWGRSDGVMGLIIGLRG